MSPQEIWIFLILSLQNKTETEINLLPVFDRKNTEVDRVKKTIKLSVRSLENQNSSYIDKY